MTSPFVPVLPRQLRLRRLLTEIAKGAAVDKRARRALRAAVLEARIARLSLALALLCDGRWGRQYGTGPLGAIAAARDAQRDLDEVIASPMSAEGDSEPHA
jgi:hypothetical protein